MNINAYYLSNYISIFLIFSAHQLGSEKARSICQLPGGCSLKDYHIIGLGSSEIFSVGNVKGLRCHIKNSHFRFDFESWLLKNQSEVCRQAGFEAKIELKMMTSKNILFSKSFNLQGAIDFFLLFKPDIAITFSYVKSFSADLGIKFDESSPLWKNTTVARFNLIRSRLDFSVNDYEHKMARSCQDYVDANLTTPRSIFQIYMREEGSRVNLINCIYKHPLCPLIFKNARIKNLFISGMNEHFFRRNILTFSKYESNTFGELNSQVLNVNLYIVENVPLDMNFLNPIVFKKIRSLCVFDSISRIDDNLFSYFNELEYIQLEAEFLRKILHKQGIEWMRSLNRNLRVNLSDPRDIKRNQNKQKLVKLRFSDHCFIREVFPDEDFCLQVEFPFEQLVAFDSGEIDRLAFDQEFDSTYPDNRPTCTLRWLAKHVRQIKIAFYSDESDDSEISNISSETCNFTKMLEKCNKTSWKKSRSSLVIYLNDLQSLNIGLLFLIKLATYVMPLFGLFTNTLVIYIIRRKENADIFKGFKQFDYLCLISFFNIIILIIQAFSWMSDCSYITNIGCLDIRKSVFIQFLRVIIKEAFVVALRFMCNFAYIGFAFNRILLIGRDHPKFVESIAKCTTRKFLIVSGIISIAFSIVKGFKYRVNYDHSEANYPYTVDNDIWMHNSSLLSVYFFFSMIADILNYLVFSIVSLGIDIYMLVCLRRTLEEKLKRCKNMKGAEMRGDGMLSPEKMIANGFRMIKNNGDGSKNKLDKARTKSESKKELDMKSPMNNAIRMVVTNSLLNVAFKFPLCIVPILNLVFTFALYNNHKLTTLKYLDFVGSLHRIHLISFISEFADFLFLILISIQLFIYIRFDLKMKSGLRRLLGK